MIPVTTIDTAIGAVIGSIFTVSAGYIFRNIRPTLVYELESFGVTAPEGYKSKDNYYYDMIRITRFTVKNSSLSACPPCAIHIEDCARVVNYRIEKSADLSKDSIKFEILNGTGVLSFPKIASKSEIIIDILSDESILSTYTSVSSTTADVKLKKYRKREFIEYFSLILFFLIISILLLSIVEQTSTSQG